MEYKVLYLFVEGPDDERFFRSVIEPLIGGRFDFVKYILYAQQSKAIIESLIRPLNHNQNHKYLFVCDMDARGDATFCISERKEKEHTAFGSNILKDRIIVVREEIESWYYAGIVENDLQKIKMKPISTTENLTKEDFEKLIPKNFTSKTDFMIEILKTFSLQTASEQNPSFSYLLRRLEANLK